MIQAVYKNADNNEFHVAVPFNETISILGHVSEKISVSKKKNFFTF